MLWRWRLQESLEGDRGRRGSSFHVEQRVSGTSQQTGDPLVPRELLWKEGTSLTNCLLQLLVVPVRRARGCAYPDGAESLSEGLLPQILFRSWNHAQGATNGLPRTAVSRAVSST